MKRTLVLIWALFALAEKRRALIMLALVILMALAEALGMLSIMPYLSVLARPGIVHEHPLLLALFQRSGTTDLRNFILVLGLATIAVVVLSSGFKTVTLHLVNRFVHLQRHTVSARLLSRYLDQPYEFFLTRNPSELGKNVLSEVDQLIFDLLQPLAMLIAQGAVVVAVALVVFVYDPLMALCIMVVVGALYGTIYLLVRTRLASIGELRAAANTGRYKSCNESLGGIKDVKVTHSAPAYVEEFSKNSREFSRHSATAETLSQSPLYIVEAVGYSGLILISLVLLWRSEDIAQVLPVLGLYGFAAYRLLPAMQIMYRGFARLRFSTSILDNIHRDLGLPKSQKAVTGNAIHPQKDIRVQGIRYSYPSSPNRPVLDDFHLRIPANTIVGITGPSGAGKSTLLDLLLGLLQPQEGNITVDGVPITSESAGNWQRGIGYVPQHVYLADASVAENIAFGVSNERIDMPAVKRAARAAQIHEFVTSELPQGYATRVGDRGTRLSGGQRQRIGIARALYRDPSVLLMDEATSALDSTTEEAINAAIRELSGEKTIVIIAHRDASLQVCDQIVALGTRPGHQLNPQQNN